MAIQRLPIPVRILNGQALSNEVNVGPHRIAGIAMPAGWDPASITLQALVNQVGTTLTFGEVMDAAHAAVTLATTPAAGEYIAIADTAPLQGLGRIKLRSGTSGVPVNQTAQRDFFIFVLTDD